MLPFSSPWPCVNVVIARCTKPSITIMHCRHHHSLHRLSHCRIVDAVNLACFCQPRSRAAIIAISLFEPPTFLYSHPLFHCHLFIARCHQPYVTACHLLSSSSFSSLACAIFVAMHLKCHRLLCKYLQLNITINIFIHLLILSTFCHHGPLEILTTFCHHGPLSMPQTLLASVSQGHALLSLPLVHLSHQPSIYFILFSLPSLH